MGNQEGFRWTGVSIIIMYLYRPRIESMVNVLKFCSKVTDRMAYANSADSDQTASGQSDLGLHCLPFH